MVLCELGAVCREVIAGVKIGVAQELEGVAVELIAAGLGENQDLAAAVVAIFGVKATGEDTEFFDRIEIGNDRSTHVDIFFDVAAVDAEAIRGFPLATDRSVAGVEVAGRRGTGDAAHHNGIGLLRSGGNDAGLDGEETSEAAAIERDVGHLGCGDGFTRLGGGQVDGNAVGSDVHNGRF